MRTLGFVVLSLFVAAPALAEDDDGDLRPEARAILEAAARAPTSPTLAEVLARSPAKPAVELAPPETIRVWRRKLDGSTASCAGRVDVIPFEDYVKGVVPNEWIPSWDDRALEMGAVCARTFAWFLVKAGGKYECADVDDTTASQVYTELRLAKTSAATDRTRGMAVVRDGSIVLAEYSAENGSPTAFGVDEPHCAGKAVYGHGRGTCQWGTQRWATLEGKDFRWMAAHYYPGAAVWEPPAPRPMLAAEVVDLVAPDELVVGREATITVELLNSGAAAWDEHVRLGTRAPSPLATDGWLDATRAVAVGAVAPGARARLSFGVVAAAPGGVDAVLELVRDEGGVATWFPGEAVPLSLRAVAAPDDGPGEEPVDAVDVTGGCQLGAAQGGGDALVWLLLLAARRRRR